MSFFSVDGFLYRLISRLWDVVKLSIVWLVFSLPIVTLGGATIAVFDVTMRMVDEQEGYVVHQFYQSFRKNWKVGIPYGILMLFCAYIVWLDFSLFEQLPEHPMVLLIAGIFSTFFFVMAFLFAYPLQAKYENTLMNTLKNSVRIATKFYVRTLSLLLALAIEIVFMAWNTTTLLIGVLIGPASIMLTISGYASYYFKEIEKEPGAVSNPDKTHEG